MKYLTENGADINVKNNKNETPLYLLTLAAEEELEDQSESIDSLNQECFKVVEYMKSISEESR